jgi:putative DNA primase/helicase
MQRFNLLVWPDQTPEWKETDRYPNGEARTKAWEAFERLDKLDPDAIGAERDQFESLPFLRFDGHAQGLFSEWHGDLERRLRSSEMAPALEGHLSKYRKLVPTIALINHLADGGMGPIPAPALARAVALAEYLETHARRVYGAGAAHDTAAARLILARIHKGDLADGFSARDIRIKEWSGLTDSDQITASLELLTDCGWIAQTTTKTGGDPAPCTQSTRRRGDEFSSAGCTTFVGYVKTGHRQKVRSHSVSFAHSTHRQNRQNGHAG